MPTGGQLAKVPRYQRYARLTLPIFATGPLRSGAANPSLGRQYFFTPPCRIFFSFTQPYTFTIFIYTWVGQYTIK